MKSNIWTNRQSKDEYVKKAKKKGFLSRAAYKLIEIEKKYKFINNSKIILEIGSSPGSWSQVIIEFNKNAKVDAYDLLDMKFKHKNINFVKKDFLNLNINNFDKKYDLILSDLAPNTIGHKSTDHLRISSLIDDIIDKLGLLANTKSNFVAKIWKGSEEKFILKNLKEKYKNVSYFKPKSSRQDSSEIFIVAQNFLN